MLSRGPTLFLGIWETQTLLTLPPSQFQNDHILIHTTLQLSLLPTTVLTVINRYGSHLFTPCIPHSSITLPNNPPPPPLFSLNIHLVLKVNSNAIGLWNQFCWVPLFEAYRPSCRWSIQMSTGVPLIIFCTHHRDWHEWPWEGHVALILSN